MKAILFYIAAGAIALHAAGHVAARTAEGMTQAAEARAERICEVAAGYCD